MALPCAAGMASKLAGVQPDPLWWAEGRSFRSADSACTCRCACVFLALYWPQQRGTCCANARADIEASVELMQRAGGQQQLLKISAV